MVEPDAVRGEEWRGMSDGSGVAPQRHREHRGSDFWLLTFVFFLSPRPLCLGGEFTFLQNDAVEWINALARLRIADVFADALFTMFGHGLDRSPISEK